MFPQSERIPAGRVEVVALWLYEEEPFPNNPLLPALHYRRAFELYGEECAARMERSFAANGWSNGWRNGVYPFHHYHSTAHEVLGCYRGSASVQLGGPAGPIVALVAGDVVVIPAGVAHRAVEKSPDFAVVGCYANGADYDMCGEDVDERPAAEARIARVAAPEADPVYGPSGPLPAHWRA